LREETKRACRDFESVIDAFAVACLNDGEEMAFGRRDHEEPSAIVMATRAALEDAIAADRATRPAVDWREVESAALSHRAVDAAGRVRRNDYVTWDGYVAAMIRAALEVAKARGAG
jgi:hypothetical protein